MLYLISSSDDGRVRSDLMRTFLKTTRESDYVKKSLLSFFSRFWGSFSLFFLYLSLFVVARARAVSLSFSSSFANDNAPGWRRRFGDALDDDDENHSALNVCVDVQKDGWLRSESWTDAFLFVSTLNKACVGKKRKERERIDFRWR